ncbi:MAG: hypothetical protein K2X27_26790, partial [Candidatus Obscuribacterales bacterium]|nr:hypothetical protein [Candidatus Obscuribacterales bacterium]
VSSPLAEAARLVESILCDNPPRDSARELILARLAAARSLSSSERRSNLETAALLSDRARPYDWRDAMRSHFELAEFDFAAGNLRACAGELDLTLGILMRYFSPGNQGMAQMLRVRSTCLRAAGCELGALHAEELAQKMERGGR